MSFFLALIVFINSPDSTAFDKIARLYSSASGISWTIQSITNSTVFEESDTSEVIFKFNPPDTIYMKSEVEEIIGIGDTLWTMSKKNKQIQKKLMGDFVMPSDLIIGWDRQYELAKVTANDGTREFQLMGKKGVFPSEVRIVANPENKIVKILYKNSAGDDVTLTVKKEKLKHSNDISYFYKNIPPGYKFLDIIE